MRSYRFCLQQLIVTAVNSYFNKPDGMKKKKNKKDNSSNLHWNTREITEKKKTNSFIRIQNYVLTKLFHLKCIEYQCFIVFETTAVGAVSPISVVSMPAPLPNSMASLVEATSLAHCASFHRVNRGQHRPDRWRHRLRLGWNPQVEMTTVQTL